MKTDKQLIRERFEASFGRYDRLALVQQRICDELAARAAVLCGGCVAHILEVGAGTGFMTRRLAALFPEARWTLNDLVPAAEKWVAQYTAGRATDYLWGDAELLDFPREVDMVASSSTIQWFDDTRAFVAKAADATRRGGWLALSTFGPGNFAEIRTTTGEGLDYLTADELHNILTDSGYRILAMSEYTESLAFPTPSDVLHHIGATGVNSLKKARWTRASLARFDSDYRRLFPVAGGVSLTYHPILIIAEKI